MVNVEVPTARVTVEAHAGEVVISPDPLARTKLVAKKARWLVVGIIVVLAVLGTVLRQELSWGDVATWTLAVTTLLAFVAAAFAGLVAYDLLKVETARDLNAAEERSIAAAERKRADKERAEQREAAERQRAEERDAAERAQATKVTAWFDFFEVLRTDEDPPKPDATWGARIRNASELSIFDVRVFFFWVNDSKDGRPWTTEERYASLERFRVIPPEQTRHLALPATVRSGADECSDDVYLVAIEFTDASGIRWRRDERGALGKVALQVVQLR